MRIVFMGTPEFAVPSLRALVENGMNVVGVITSTDKWGGRGRKQLLQSDVKKYAVSKGLRILQPPNLKNEKFIQELQSLYADLQVIVAFRMLPEVVWNMPPLGSINLHASLLPRYRGAAPIHWAIIRGEVETGLTTFRLRHEIDTGPMLHQVRTPIGLNETTGDLHDRMKDLGAQLVLRSVADFDSGRIEEIPQQDVSATTAPKIFHDDCRISFDRPVQGVHNFIRGLSPWPRAWTLVDESEVKLIRSRIAEDFDSSIHHAGQIDLSLEGRWMIACQDGWIEIIEVQMQGAKAMQTRDWLHGYTPQCKFLN